MSYRQLVTPNLDPVVHVGGSILTDWYGWCLAVAWTAFGGRTTNPTAWDAWTSSLQYKHTGAPPSGVYVPVWFSGFGGSGHVAIYKDGTVWSSPYTHKATVDVLGSISEVEQVYGVRYVGWSEDIGSVRVVEPIIEGEVMTEDGVRYGYLAVTGKTTADKDAGYTERDVQYWVGRDSTEFTKNLYGFSDYYIVAANREIAALKAQITSMGAPTVLAPGTYTVK